MKNLLTPRCRVIADYFYSPYKIGDIIEPNERGAVHLTTTVQYDSFDGQNHDVVNYMPFETVTKYPHLFRILEWWESRNTEDMPEYVKVDANDTELPNAVVKVKNWDFSEGSDCICDIEHEYYLSIGKETVIYPATEQEYNDFVNTKKTDR